MLALRCAYSGGYGWFWYVSRIGTGQLVAAVGGGARPPQPGGHYTSQSHGIPASAAFTALVTQLAASAAVHPDGNTEIAEFQHVYKMPATEVQEQRWVGDIESTRVHASNRGQSTPNIQAVLAAGTESEYHHPLRHQPDCVYPPFQERDFAPDAAGWVVEPR